MPETGTVYVVQINGAVTSVRRSPATAPATHLLGFHNRSAQPGQVVYNVSGDRVGEDAEPQHSMRVVTRLSDAEVEVRCRIKAMGHGGRYIADAGAVFTLSAEDAIEDSIQKE